MTIVAVNDQTVPDPFNAVSYIVKLLIYSSRRMFKFVLLMRSVTVDFRERASLSPEPRPPSSHSWGFNLPWINLVSVRAGESISELIRSPSDNQSVAVWTTTSLWSRVYSEGWADWSAASVIVRQVEKTCSPPIIKKKVWTLEFI